ncbi:0ba7ce74-9fcd-4485-8b29-cfd0bf62b77e [Sclerotinia trifoliorum]|uniref:0ba7ce74-9fcd-4485-8b29-cfd0bf62b77e n=1 Tax=Sclerotinia trifoliorum TaxID=28548 RepID=A0A8H2W3B8_9HELO|nr:0ba7ce74-9fcd-4485-8b29-cfd0bf62b77e [Sclerotinia trifoliorum]
MYSIRSKPITEEINHQTRTCSNTDPKQTKRSHSNSTASTDSGYASGWGSIHFCSKGSYRQNSLFNDDHPTCEGHPVVFEYGDDVKVLYVGEAKVTNVREQMGKSRAIIIDSSSRRKKLGSAYRYCGSGCDAHTRNSWISEKPKPIRRGKMVKDERGRIAPVYCDEGPIDLGRRIAWESISFEGADDTGSKRNRRRDRTECEAFMELGF